MSYKEETSPSLFIVVEGVMEASGKSTVVQTMKELLEAKGFGVLNYRQPGGTLAAEDMRRIVKNPNYEGEDLNEVVEYLLFSASREQADHTLVKPALDRGDVVISDRHYLTTHAYQGQRIPEIDRLVARKPDMTIFLEAPFELCMQRMTERGDNCRIEARGEAWFRSMYDELKVRINDGIHGEVVRIDTTDFESETYKEGIKMALTTALNIKEAKQLELGIDDDSVTVKEFEGQVLAKEGVRVIIRADVNQKVKPYSFERLDDDHTYGQLMERLNSVIGHPFAIASVKRKPTNETPLVEIRVPKDEGICECL